MIMTSNAAWNRCRQIACFRRRRPRPVRSNHINTTQKLYRDRPVCSTTRQRRTGPEGAARRNRLGCDAVKAAPLNNRRCRICRDPSRLRSSPFAWRYQPRWCRSSSPQIRPPSFHFAECDICRLVLFWWCYLFYFIVSSVVCRYAPFDCKFSDSECCKA